MVSEPTSSVAGIQKRHLIFSVFVVASCLVFYKTVSELVRYSLHDDSASHVILIPVIAFFLIGLERSRIFSITRSSPLAGIGLTGVGLILFWQASRFPPQQPGSWSFSLQILSILVVWLAGFLWCYGFHALRAAAFPLLFLLLTIPVPDELLDRITYALQAGSTAISYSIFQAVGTPVVRQGFVLLLPGVAIEIAKECSSIRSSIALLITCLLAAHLYLRTTWKIILFVVLAMVVSVVKNGIRIATLTLLSIHVDPGFLTGKLHQRGGFVFFLIALAILYPILLLLQKSEHSGQDPETGKVKATLVSES
jgi:exosortase